MKSFTAAAILSMLALSGTSFAMPKQANDQTEQFKDIFQRPMCRNGEGSFVQQECQKMCGILLPGENLPNAAASGAGPKPTPGACNVVPVPVKKDITMTYQVRVPGATGAAGHKKTTTVVKATQPTPTPNFFLCTGCVAGGQDHHGGNYKRAPYPIPA